MFLKVLPKVPEMECGQAKSWGFRCLREKNGSWAGSSRKHNPSPVWGDVTWHPSKKKNQKPQSGRKTEGFRREKKPQKGHGQIRKSPNSRYEIYTLHCSVFELNIHYKEQEIAKIERSFKKQNSIWGNRWIFHKVSLHPKTVTILSV